MDAATFRALGHELVDQLATLMADVPSGPVARDESATPIRAAIFISFDSSVTPGTPRWTVRRTPSARI